MTGPLVSIAPPAPRLIRKPRWEMSEDRSIVRFWDEAQNNWQRWNPWTAIVIEGIEAGDDFIGLRDRLAANWPGKNPAYAEVTVRRFLYTLFRLGTIDLPLEAPDVFGGRYARIKELGRGGVGVAYLCEDRERGERLVVKRPWEYFTTLAKADEYLRAEADVMRRFDHPAIAGYRDTLEQDGLFHLVRDFVEGRELAAERGVGIPDATKRRRLARAIAHCLGHMHERGYVMLDLRPANFFLTPEPLLIDVGHCKAHHGGEIEIGNRHGSPGFAAPELVRDGRASVRTDVWGFARLYFFMATGKFPKNNDDAASIDAKMAEHGSTDADRALVAACGADDPAARPATMRDVGALLD